MAKTPLNRFIGEGATSYTIPTGKYFVGRIHGRGAPVSCTINSKELSVMASGSEMSNSGPIVLVAGDIVANSQSVNYIHLMGFLYDL